MLRVAAGRSGRPRRRGRRHVVATAVSLAYLLAGGATLLAGRRISDGLWLGLHLVLLGAVSNAIVAWSEHFAAALLHARAVSDWAALARTGALNLAVAAVLTGVHRDQPALLAAGTGLLGLVVAAHALTLVGWHRRALAARLGQVALYYVAAAGALLGGIGLGLLLSGGGLGSADAWRAVRLAHVHLNLLGWVGLTVIGTLFTLWPTVLRTRMAAGVSTAATAAFLLLVGGLAVTTAGLLLQQRAVATAGLAGYAGGLGTALGPFVATMRRRRPAGAAAWMLAAGVGWLLVAVATDLAMLLGSARVVDLDRHGGRLLAAVVVGFALQMLTGALSFLLPVVWGRGAWGNRRLTRLLETGWPARVAALNLGVALRTLAPPDGLVAHVGWGLIGLAIGAFVLLATMALTWRLTTDPDRTGHATGGAGDDRPEGWRSGR
jgi:nitrite reductase (NO-forming)